MCQHLNFRLYCNNSKLQDDQNPKLFFWSHLRVFSSLKLSFLVLYNLYNGDELEQDSYFVLWNFRMLLNLQVFHDIDNVNNVSSIP